MIEFGDNSNNFTICTHTCTTVSYSDNVFSITMLEALFWFIFNYIEIQLHVSWNTSNICVNYSIIGILENSKTLNSADIDVIPGILFIALYIHLQNIICAKECFFLIYMQASMGKKWGLEQLMLHSN